MVMDKVKVKENWVRGATIGRGSYGTVSLGVNKSSGMAFAVKSVEKSSCLPHQLEALENEIRILRSVSSPYLVEFFGDGVTVEEDTRATPVSSAAGKNCFRNLYLEYLPGGTVADLSRARKSGGGAADVDEIIVKNYTFCMVSALKYLHSKGIVHCDIKSDNVLVGSDSFTAKLTDFGSAMEVSPLAGGDETKIKNDKIRPRGSPLWMAPEVVRQEYQGPESDVWSLGCTIIEMVTGKPAWENKDHVATLCRIGYSEFLPELPTELSELGRDFLEKCLRREPKERWNCDQLLKHPFISKSSSPVNSESHSTPRCILDWFSLDSDEEDNEETNKDDDNRGGEICTSKVKDRIRELASGTGANWESDGWIVVRSSESSDAGRCNRDEEEEEEEEGTSSTYSELRVESEIQWRSLDHMDSLGIEELSRRTNAEYFLDSDRSPLREDEEEQPDHQNGVVSVHLEVGSFFLLFYLLSNISWKNYNTCIQLTIFLTYIRIFWYILFLLLLLV